jgi:hypothetical protein
MERKKREGVEQQVRVRKQTKMLGWRRIREKKGNEMRTGPRKNLSARMAHGAW